MTATEKLRKMLDERGIGYTKRASEVIDYEREGVTYRAFGIDGGIRIKNITPISPSTAVDMTLGRETCHDTEEDSVRFTCSACGSAEGEYVPRYCPNCGRQVV